MSFSIRVLVVEEEPAPARELQAACLEGRDGEVEVAGAADAAAGASQLGEGDFDLIVHSLADDLELFRAIGRDHAGVPVVVVSDSPRLLRPPRLPGH